MPRTEQIRIRVSAEEKERAEKVAKAEGLTLSAYLRRCIVISKNKQLVCHETPLSTQFDRSTGYENV